MMAFKFVLAAALFAVSLLSVFKAPGIWGWKLAVLVTEFGQFVGLLPMGIGIWILVTERPRTFFVWVCLTLCVVSLGLFSKPSLQAFAISRRLPGELDLVLGEVGRIEPFSLARLFKFGGEESPRETLVYGASDDGKELRLDFYPAVGTELAPCVLVVHGGGWDGGSRDEIAGLNSWLAKRGYAVAAIEYRLAPDNHWPAPMEDLQMALVYLKKEAGRLGIDRERFALFGRSAGGQIVSAAAANLHDSSVRCAIAFYAPHDMEFAWKYGKEDDVLNSLRLLSNYLGGDPDSAPERYRSASAYLQKDKALARVPILLVHGASDTLVWVKQSRRFAEKLSGAGGRSFYLELPWATHGFEFNQNGPSGQLALYSLERFLQRELRKGR